MPDPSTPNNSNIALETAATAAVAAARAAPLSRKKAMLAILVVDAAIDARLAQTGASDILAHRGRLAAADPALALIMALAAMPDPGPRLVVEPVPVPPENYPALSTEDFMVSLYNTGTVQRVLVALPDGTRRDVYELLAAALAALA